MPRSLSRLTASAGESREHSLTQSNGKGAEPDSPRRRSRGYRLWKPHCYRLKDGWSRSRNVLLDGPDHKSPCPPRHTCRLSSVAFLSHIAPPEEPSSPTYSRAGCSRPRTKQRTKNQRFLEGAKEGVKRKTSQSRKYGMGHREKAT